MDERRRGAVVEDALRRRSSDVWLGVREEEVRVDTGSEMRDEGADSRDALSESGSSCDVPAVVAATALSYVK